MREGLLKRSPRSMGGAAPGKHLAGTKAVPLPFHCRAKRDIFSIKWGGEGFGESQFFEIETLPVLRVSFLLHSYYGYEQRFCECWSGSWRI